VEVVDGRGRRFGLVYVDDWDTPRFRLLSPWARVTYVTLLTFVNPAHGQAYPKQRRLCGIIGASESTLRRALRELTDLGYVSTVVTRQGFRSRNVYTILSPPPYPPPPELS
jgi:hypothetical protein